MIILGSWVYFSIHEHVRRQPELGRVAAADQVWRIVGKGSKRFPTLFLAHVK